MINKLFKFLLAVLIIISPFQWLPLIDKDLLILAKQILFIITFIISLYIVKQNLSLFKLSFKNNRLVLFAVYSGLVLFEFIMYFDKSSMQMALFNILVIIIISASCILKSRDANLVPFLFNIVVYTLIIVVILDFGLMMHLGSDLIPANLPFPPDQLRFAGAHINPNATAKFNLILYIFALYYYMTKTNYWFVVLLCLVLAMFVLLASGSKSILIALMLITILSIYILYESCRVKVFLRLMILSIIVALFYYSIEPVYKKNISELWVSSSRTDVEAINKNDKLDFDIKKSLRIGHEIITIQNDVNKIQSTVHVDCGILCTGQRLRLWIAGLEYIIYDMPWYGGGLNVWVDVLYTKLKFHFDSPHNGLIETIGRFGVGGFLIYINLLYIVFNLSKNFIKYQSKNQDVYSYVSFVFIISLIIIEVFEPTKFFALSPHFFLVWFIFIVFPKSE